MKVYIRKWSGRAVYETIATIPIGSFDGISFRQMEERTATTTNFNHLRATEIYMHASEPNALVVYVEEVKA